MAKRKAASKAATDVLATSGTPSSSSDIPLAKYLSLALTQPVLLAFIVLVVPKTTLAFLPLPQQQSSLDRPQPEWMAPITAWPMGTVAWWAAGAAVIQIYWGERVRRWSTRIDKERSREGRHFIRAWIATFLVALALHFLVVLLGAPINAKILHTFSLSMLISILAVYPSARVFTIPSISPTLAEDKPLRERWIRVFNHLSARTPLDRALLHPSLLTLLGAWAGAYALALDWDRPWQAYPLPPAFGAVVGYCLGSVNAGFVSAVIESAKGMEDPLKKQ